MCEGGRGKGSESRRGKGERGWSAKGLAGVTRCDSEHIGSQGGCYFTLQSHSPPVPQDILIWSSDPRRREHSTTLLRGKRESGTEPSHEILFAAFSFHLCGWVFNFITKMAAPVLITFCFICWLCVDAAWTNGLSWPGLCVNCVYMCTCLQAHSTTFDWISQRETSTLSASPLLHW